MSDYPNPYVLAAPDGAGNPKAYALLSRGIQSVVYHEQWPLHATAEIICATDKLPDGLSVDHDIIGIFGGRTRSMTITEIQTDMKSHATTIQCMQTDIWLTTRQISRSIQRRADLEAGRMPQVEEYVTGAFPSLLHNFVQRISPHPPKIYASKGLVTDALASTETQIKIFYEYVFELIERIVGLYTPAWDADMQVMFRPPRVCRLMQSSKDILVRSITKRSSPTLGWGHGGDTWARCQIGSLPPPRGHYERIYDMQDAYIHSTIAKLTQAALEDDLNDRECYQVEVIHTHGQAIGIGDIIETDLTAARLRVNEISYDHSPGRVRMYLQIGRAPATLAERLERLRTASARDHEHQWDALPLYSERFADEPIIQGIRDAW